MTDIDEVPAEHKQSDGCNACPIGRMSDWAPLQSARHYVTLGPHILVARTCDRCYGVQVQARKPKHRGTPGTPAPARSAGGALLDGVIQNIVAAIREAREAVRRRLGW